MTLQAVEGQDITVSRRSVRLHGERGFNGTTAGTNNTVNAALRFNTAADGVVAAERRSAHPARGRGDDRRRWQERGELGVCRGHAGPRHDRTDRRGHDGRNANKTIVRVDSALTSVSSLRSTLGAIQNRFESTITNLTTAAENLTASRSRIQDADFAQETAALTRAQILQQAGMAILAQANAVPQNVLSLLR